ncbi:MAG: HD domain-containing protein [Clostridiales bacterium]|nr:HD domain-containing protein [Candidatus Equinaster intestinalis]
MEAQKSISSYDYLLEKRLKEINPELHTLYSNSVFAMDRLLENYKAIFPFFTNHTFGHSEQVINYCNLLGGYDNIYKLNADEIYILLMGASLHDIGMGISVHDFEEFKYKLKGYAAYEQNHIVVTVKEVCRSFHQELSAEFIKKYKNLFEIPSDGHCYCICQIARGHRKMDLLDKNEFNPEYKLENGNTVRLPYLAALVKLADELDITADRNLCFDYTKDDSRWSKTQKMCYKCHGAIKNITGTPPATLTVHYATSEPEVIKEIKSIDEKLHKVFKEYISVIESQSDFEQNIEKIEFVKI